MHAVLRLVLCIGRKNLDGIRDLLLSRSLQDEENAKNDRHLRLGAPRIASGGTRRLHWERAQGYAVQTGGEERLVGGGSRNT